LKHKLLIYNWKLEIAADTVRKELGDFIICCYMLNLVDEAVFEGNHFVFDLHLFYYVYLTHYMYNITMFNTVYI